MLKAARPEPWPVSWPAAGPAGPNGRLRRVAAERPWPSTPQVPPLVVLRSMLAARHKLSPKLCANLVEAVEARNRPNQEASFRNALPAARLAKLHANQQKLARAGTQAARQLLVRRGGVRQRRAGLQPKHAGQRRSRCGAAVPPPAAPVRGGGAERGWPQSRTSTPDVIVDAGPLYALGIQWVDLKHAFGRGSASRYVAQVAKYGTGARGRWSSRSGTRRRWQTAACRRPRLGARYAHGQAHAERRCCGAHAAAERLARAGRVRIGAEALTCPERRRLESTVHGTTRHVAGLFHD